MQSPDRVLTRADLANLLGKTEDDLNRVLDAVDQGSYYRTRRFKKSNGQPRLIHAVREPMKGLQRELLATLSKSYSPTKFAHGFVAGRSIVTNASVHKRKRLVVKTDIKDFFPSITFARVVGMFGAQPFQFGNEAAIAAALICCTKDDKPRLPQGGAMSPFVSNMVCRRMDKRLNVLAIKHRCVYSRYADDLAFSTNDTGRISASDLLEQVHVVLNTEGFAPNPNKARALRRGERQIIAGVVVNEGLNVPRRYVRNLRALLHNCEKDGIASQIERPNGFKDDRNSRVSLIKRETGDFLAGRKVLTAREAEVRFVRHLVGRLMFVRQIVLADRQGDDEKRYPRVTLLYNLMFRLYELIEKRHKDVAEEWHRGAVKELRRQLGKHTPSTTKLWPLEDRRVAKEQSRDTYLKKREVASNLAKLKAAQTNEELMQVVHELRRFDARFFALSCGGALEKEKKNVKDMLTFPPFSADATFNLLMSLMDPSGLGPLVHEVNDFNGRRAQELLLEHYYPTYFQLPFDLRDSFDAYIRELDDRIDQLGPSLPLNPLTDSILSEATRTLKQKTRFGGNPREGSLLGGIVSEAFDSASERVGGHKRSMIQNLERTIFYTHVPSIKRALVVILESMLKNSESEKIFVQSRREGDFVVLSVSDRARKTIVESRGREFAHGKISEAVRLLNGICSYKIQAMNHSGIRFRVDMLSELAPEILGESDNIGFDHLMYFKIKA